MGLFRLSLHHTNNLSIDEISCLYIELCARGVLMITTAIPKTDKIETAIFVSNNPHTDKHYRQSFEFIRLGLIFLAVISIIFLYISCSAGPEHEHTYRSEWSTDYAYHWHEATCGHDVVSDKAEHSWIEVIIKEPTHYERGEKKIYRATDS